MSKIKKKKTDLSSSFIECVYWIISATLTKTISLHYIKWTKKKNPRNQCAWEKTMWEHLRTLGISLTLILFFSFLCLVYLSKTMNLEFLFSTSKTDEMKCNLIKGNSKRQTKTIESQTNFYVWRSLFLVGERKR